MSPRWTKADLLDQAPLIIAFHDRQNRIAWANRAYLEATGLSPEAIRDKPCYEAWGLSNPCRGCPVITAIETGEPAESELTPWNQDHWPERQGCWLSRAAPVRDATGKVVGAIEVAQDITDLKESHRKLVRQARVLDQVHDAVVTTDLEGRITSWNRGAERTHGYAEEEVLLQPVGMLFPDEHRTTFHDVVQARLRGADETDLEIPMRRRSGEVFHAHLSVSLLRDADGEPEGTVGYALDITDRVEAEVRLKEVNRKLRQTGHDLGERVKELTCLHGVSRLTADPDLPLEEILQGVAECLPPGWQYPAVTAARIRLDGETYATEGFRDTPWMQQAAIRVDGEEVGAVEVALLEEKPDLDAGPFLVEERALIDGIARRLGAAIARRRAVRAAREANERLVAANRQLCATEQHLRAANQQLEANNQQLRSSEQQLQAANQQLAAANQQLRSSEQQLQAVNQQLRATNQQLAQSEARAGSLARFPDENPYPVLRVARDGPVLHANAAATRILEAQGCQVGAPAPEAWRQCVVEAFETGMVVRREVRHAGAVFDFRWMPVADEGYANIYGVDVTEQKVLQDQLRQAQKLEAVGRLAGGVAHDFNNMLQTILGYTELLLAETDASGHVHEQLLEIRGAGRRSAALTRQLLAFARKQTIAPKVLDLNDTIGCMLKMLQRLIGEDIDLRWHPDADLGSVEMDPAQVDQVLANLAVNARDAIGGVGTLTIETHNVEIDAHYADRHAEVDPGRYVMLAVSDDGSGMDAETLDNIFEPFFTTKSATEGTGLGLATVYGIAKQNRGFVHVYSEPGQGTTFRIYLPRCDRRAEAAPATPEISELPRGTETVLVVEDEASLLGLCEQVLRRLGYAVLAERLPEDALAAAAAHDGPLHLLLTDVVMPQLSGRDLWDRLRAERSDLKCLFMSGYTANAIAHRGVLDAGLHFVQKPFSVLDLAVKVRRVLDASEEVARP